MSTIGLDVQGMSGGSCVKHVTQALKPTNGVDDVAVDLQSGHVRVSGTFDAGADHLISALTAAGYPATLAGVRASPSPENESAAAQTSGRGVCCGH